MQTIRHYRLRDLQTGHLVAMFAASGSIGSKCGALKVNVDFGEDFFNMVVLTIIAVLEKDRQDRPLYREIAGPGVGG